jgi:hypothetical protein
MLERLEWGPACLVRLLYPLKKDGRGCELFGQHLQNDRQLVRREAGLLE